MSSPLLCCRASARSNLALLGTVSSATGIGLSIVGITAACPVHWTSDAQIHRGKADREAARPLLVRAILDRNHADFFTDSIERWTVTWQRYFLRVYRNRMRYVGRPYALPRHRHLRRAAARVLARSREWRESFRKLGEAETHRN